LPKRREACEVAGAARAAEAASAVVTNRRREAVVWGI